ncbi:MAG: hypothetical protein RMY62_020650 [Nostoc sp. ZfuVER08]|nr:hypothetical protein [Nostoc punctiforme]
MPIIGVHFSSNPYLTKVLPHPSIVPEVRGWKILRQQSRGGVTPSMMLS